MYFVIAKQDGTVIVYIAININLCHNYIHVLSVYGYYINMSLLLPNGMVQ